MLEPRVDGELIRQVAELRRELIAAEREFARSAELRLGEGSEPAKSAANLVHYLALRRHDLRQTQMDLSRLGLSSLGRLESHTLWGLTRVIEALTALHRAKPGDVVEQDLGPEGITPEEASAVLDRRSDALLGPVVGERRVRVMVTMPREAADSPGIIRGLLAAGMNIMRVNAAHDDEAVWLKMLGNLESARRELGLPCRVLIDLAGPKVRTGELEPGPRVVRWNPPRDVLGRPTRPARVRLTWNPSPEKGPGFGGDDGDEGVDAMLPVDRAFIDGLEVGSEVRLRDARGRRRLLIVREREIDGVIAEGLRAAYVIPGTSLECGHGTDRRQTIIGDLPPVIVPLLVRAGDTLILSRDLSPGRVERRDQATGRRVLRVPFSIPEIFADVRVGQRVMIDDGKIRAEAIGVTPEGITLRIEQTKPGGASLGADKGVNFPGLNLRVPALTPEDRRVLPFVVKHADLVGLSFVRSPEDVEQLRSEVDRQIAIPGARQCAGPLGIVLKIETSAAFDNLPDLLLAALCVQPAGVMIARGDLAVECGYERLAELQEEILWLCEAAHMPVIWATQVLETLAKKGLPSRSEVTDAAMGERAECVMLNKGPFVAEAVRVLDDILRRMAEHQSKKRSMLRKLGVSDRFFASKD
jgi:pyruvate kinase